MGSDPITEPGAAQAGAIGFIDLFLSAFELPMAVADNPGIYIDGRFSGRNPYPDPRTGLPSREYPPDDFAATNGQRRFLGLSRFQELSWRVQLYGRSALVGATVPPRWKAQVGSLIPLPNEVGLREIYRAGLDGFEGMAQVTAKSSFSDTSPAHQDELLAVAAGRSAPSGRLAPSDLARARDLFPHLVTHTFQACYSLPEYGGNREGVMWRFIGWDGDTQPLGNSVYDASIAGPGKGPNAGFGAPGIYQPRGGYREFRAVSGPDRLH